MTVLAADPVPPRSDRFATRLLHDEPNLRIVSFHLLPGQRVPPHHSDSTVVVQVVEGAGVFTGKAGGALLAEGESAVFAPGEEHSVEAAGIPLRFLAILAPRPA
jgi:quercetin dioxygenase-like cupin family protein